ncbi:endonuclease/exonuclease/phosphatase family protein [Streptomyces chrestomyceticus]|uniref:endonuclease/exonuclease/phosphatase family protein n=1 Tax=Streptomyces chrestomyceticus TaxID=68185 RepID=UPI0033E349B9
MRRKRSLALPRRHPAGFGTFLRTHISGLLALVLLIGLCEASFLAGPASAQRPASTPATVPAAQQQATAVPEKVLTFNAQGGNGWEPIRNGLLRHADLVALQEVTTLPADLSVCTQQSENFILDNFGDQRTTVTGLPPQRFRLCMYRWGHWRGQNEPGYLYYLKVYEKQRTADAPLNEAGNSGKSMAIWTRSPAEDAITVEGVDPTTPNRWMRERPALGLKFDSTWFFNVHAASIRQNTTPNPHAVSLVRTIGNNAGGAPWRVLGDFNSLSDTFHQAGINRPIYNARYPDGRAVPTQQSGYPLDFMVADQEIPNLAVALSTSADSDHYPVRFAPWDPVDCNAAIWDHWTRYNAPQSLERRSAPTAACEDNGKKQDAIVSMGDSFISGEAGRWAGNANTGPGGSAWGTDRAARCESGESGCRTDLGQVYEPGTAYDVKKNGDACDRSLTAEIKGADVTGIPKERRFNIACSGARTEHLAKAGFKGQRPQVEDLKDIAKNHHIKMIAVSIGGNDLKFSDVIAACARAYFAPSALGASCKKSEQEAFEERLRQAEKDVEGAVEGVRAAMRQAGQEDSSYQLVLQSYPNPLPRSSAYRYPQNDVPVGGVLTSYGRYRNGGCPFLDEDTDWAHGYVVPKISSMLRGVAARSGSTFLDLQYAFAGHELCAASSQQATAEHSLKNPLPADQAEWIRWVPYVMEQTKDVLWGSQGHQQEAIHPNLFGQQALGACLTAAAARLGNAPQVFTCRGAAGKNPDTVQVDQDKVDWTLSSQNRRAPQSGLPDWSRAGYRGGQPLPGESAINPDPACRVGPARLAADFGVRPDDGADDTLGLQNAIEELRTRCSPYANYDKLSLIELPKGVLNISEQLSVNASFLVIRGQGSNPNDGSRLVFRPDETTRYDALTPDGGRWDQQATVFQCQVKPDEKTPPQTGQGGWIWPGRGLFRVQTLEVADRYKERCAFPPKNREDLFQGSVNQHWASGVKVAEAPGGQGFAARRGDRVIKLQPRTRMERFPVGGYIWVGAANTQKFYDEQTVPVGSKGIEDLHMRQQVFTIAAVDEHNGTVTLDQPLEFDVPVDSTSDGSAPLGGTDAKPYASKVTPLQMVVGVGFENFSFTQDMKGLPKLHGGTYDLSPEDAKHNYGNLAPEYAMHGIVFKWAANSWVRGIRADMTGSHPIVTEVAKNLQIEHNMIDGAWNKGKGGNGYLRGSRVWDSLYAHNTTRNIRHFTFQWSASNNVAIGNDFDSDLNLHGGWERRNLFENNTVRVPYEHRSSNCKANCGGEGGEAKDDSQWFPIWWAAGPKAVKWSGSSGPQNVFFRNTLTKQTRPGGPFENYAPYGAVGTGAQTVFQFGSDGSDPSRFQHLPIQDWAHNELRDFSGQGVNTSRTDAGPSLFLKSLS